MCKWATFLVEQHGKNTDFIKTFTETCNTKDTDFESAEYAYGIDILQYRGQLIYEHNGGLLGFSSKITIFPEHKLSIIVLGNTGDAPINSLKCLLADYFLKNQFTEGKDYVGSSKYHDINATPTDIIKIDTNVLNNYENYYKFGDGYIAEIKSSEYGLNISECWNNSEYTVFPINDSSFIDKMGNIRFDFNNFKDGKANKLNLISGGKKYTAVLANIEPTDSLLLIALTGFYFNNDLNIIYHFYKEHNKLFVRIGHAMPLRVIVINKDLISFFGYEAIIKSDDVKNIIGFELLTRESSSTVKFTKMSSDIYKNEINR